jgi:hypothetical protein
LTDRCWSANVALVRVRRIVAAATTAVMAVMMTIALPIAQIPSAKVVAAACCCPNPATCHCPDHERHTRGDPSVRPCGQPPELTIVAALAPFVAPSVTIMMPPLLAQSAPIVAPRAPHPAPPASPPAAPS